MKKKLKSRMNQTFLRMDGQEREAKGEDHWRHQPDVYSIIEYHESFRRCSTFSSLQIPQDDETVLWDCPFVCK